MLVELKFWGLRLLGFSSAFSLLEFNPSSIGVSPLRLSRFVNEMMVYMSFCFRFLLFDIILNTE